MMQNVLIPTMNYSDTRFDQTTDGDAASTHLFRNIGMRLDAFCTLLRGALAIIAETLNPFQFFK